MVSATLLLWGGSHTPYFGPYGLGFLSVLAAGAYLLGSVPYGLILTKLFGGEDLRTVGSGNIGATNVLRTGRKALAFFTLLLDALKAALAIYAAKQLTPLSLDPYPVMLVAATFAILGHLFPVWLSFKGGKGIASCAGSLFMLSWPVGLITLGTWVLRRQTLPTGSLGHGRLTEAHVLQSIHQATLVRHGDLHVRNKTPPHMMPRVTEVPPPPPPPTPHRFSRVHEEGRIDNAW